MSPEFDIAFYNMISYRINKGGYFCANLPLPKQEDYKP